MSGLDQTIKEDDLAEFPEGVSKVLDLIARKWIMQILYVLRNNDLTFTELKNQLGSVSNQELAKKLKELTLKELVERQDSFMTEKDTHIYVSTVTGKDLCDLLEKIQAFGDKYL